ncbi:aminoglycoside 6'-N-acetyltransferase [Alkaliphilus serpentinus]|uniref:Aminoglycoside N(6')-acetyltransferase type 1 n=1 Tax=Alkaliphilus serpentinus TaxID=1482731 RepID=A0A833HRT4_9FIRM|nr:aminoglycoside 6'-N-acetyltransferase [Alkaliphilus serpentinus]KAB3532455.1 GNAT family N-acetyltransferase [Alkaliphilus serpentinus]
MKGYIEEVSKEGFEEWVAMGLELWPDNTAEGLAVEFKNLLESAKEKAYLYKVNNKYVGFINISLRNDYVEGSVSSPVGYVEGIYIKEDYRKMGIAKLLVEKGEKWAKGKGCSQMASDIEAHNTICYDFHLNIGFKEANRLICFIKDID